MQEPLLVQGSVFDNAALGLRLRHVDRRTVEQRVGHWLERLGIAHLRQRSVRSLSGGEAQRTSLVRALALEPALLLLDEPFSALDPPSQEGLLLDLVEILRGASMTTVFVTHNRHEALTLGNRVGILVNGEVVQVGGPEEVFRQPITEAVARLVGADVMLAGTVISTMPPHIQVATAVGPIEAVGTLPVGTRVTLCLRPEDVTLYPQCQASRPRSEANAVQGTLAQITPWGGQLRVTIDSSVSLTALIPGRCAKALGLQPGQAVTMCFAASAVHVIPAP
jgi:tungstate transport system ATP-binding protein